MKQLGFVINPIAGMGGTVGLRGTDGVLDEAISKGAEPIAPRRAKEFLQKLKDNTTDLHLEVLTCPKVMGEEEAVVAGLQVKVLPMKIGDRTKAEDTRKAVKLMLKEGVDLIVFVGGDGTAKDIFDAMQDFNKAPVLGVPSGVKMYSGVFAVNPSDAAEVVQAYFQGETETTELEVMDADEEAIRSDNFIVKLYGYLESPFLPMRIQGRKEASPRTVDESENQAAIARFIIEEMRKEATYILGPGTTVKRIADLLGVEKTLLGVDLYKDYKMLSDLNEQEIMREVEDWNNTWIIVSPIGHQGILLGRGNQQISPSIIRRVGKERIIVVATKCKLQNINSSILRVDTGDLELDQSLTGYIKVATDYREWRLMPVQR